MRGRYEEITAKGADVVAIGTGNTGYAKAFIEDQHVPFTVLIDEDGSAAKAASLRKMSPLDLLRPGLWKRTLAARKGGHKQGKPGARAMQLGATFVMGPGPICRYEHLDADASDHAPLDAVLATLS